MKKPGDTWYFAYGSNLDIAQKKGRTGKIRRAEPCRLPGYRLAFNKRGSQGERFANIVPDASHEVWGVAYLCSPAALCTMDEYEGVTGGHYSRIPVRVFTKSGDALDAVTYVAGEDYVCGEGLPTSSYLQRIVHGARHHSLPEEYIRSLVAAARGQLTEDGAV
jgi:gamma-glutamylcyclotransferase (GGCT)/AIG2-like uncharacterized protein YtfP